MVWEALVRRWDAAYMNYRASMKTVVLVSDDEDAAEECRVAQAVALAELTETRKHMDSLIAEGRAKRPPLTDTLKVKTIYHGMVLSSTPQMGRKQPIAAE